MRVKYLGPSPEVNVAPYGPHSKGEAKEYPDEFGGELLATSKKQKFAVAETDAEKAKKEADAKKKAEAEAKKKTEAEAKKKAGAEAKKEAGK